MMNRNLSVSASLSLAFALAASAAAGSAGCKTEGESDEVATAEQASTAVESSAEATYVSGYFAGAAELTVRDAPIADAALTILAAAKARVMADLADPACATVDSDGVSYVQVVFAGCTGAHGVVALSGTLRAEVHFETSACGQFQCPVAVLYDVTATDLKLGRTELDGAWEVRDPLAAGEPYTWNGGLELTTPRRHVSTTTTATFTREGDCIDYSLESTIVGSGGRTYTVAADDVHRCLGECPIQGSVSVTGEAGATVSWVYDGEGGAQVTGVAGNTFDVELACAE